MKIQRKTINSKETDKKHRDNLALLFAYPQFQKEIKRIRQLLNIPADGFIGSNATQKSSEWHDNFLKKSDEFTSSKYFIQKIKDLQQKKKIKVITQPEAVKLLEELDLEIPLNKMSKEIDQVVEKFRLPVHYKFSIEQHLRYGKLLAPTSNYTISTKGTSYKLKDANCVILNIYEKLTDHDLHLIKEDVNKYFGKNLPSYKNTKNVSLGLEIERLSQESEYDYSNDISYRLTDKDIAERVLGSTKNKNELPKIKRNLKDLRKKRFTIL